MTVSIASSTNGNEDNSSLEWRDYFLHNRENLLPIPWECDYKLTDVELETISHSIRNFQLGESSEGSNLMRFARIWANQSGNPVYLEAVKLFIGEEQRHAKDLAKFMQGQGIDIIPHHWSDILFRKLRKSLNLEIAIIVLLSAELVAKVYYRALQQATRSPLLQQICIQILHDESKHVEFQCDTLSQIRAGRSRWQTNTMESLHQVFFACTLVVVWWDHRKVFCASGYTFGLFVLQSWRELKNSIQIMHE
jgi:hypothetical protein